MPRDLTNQSLKDTLTVVSSNLCYVWVLLNSNRFKLKTCHELIFTEVLLFFD